MTYIRELVGSLLFKTILYYGQERYLVGREGRIREADRGRLKRVDIVVLGKRHYFETSKTFPFTGIKDIKSAIRMDIASMAPFKTERFFIRKIAEGGGRTTLNIWFISPELCSALDELAPRLIIPESALFPFWDPFLEQGAGKIYAIDKDSENLRVYAGPDRLVKSMIGMKGDPGLLSFRRTIGAEARDCTVTVVKGMDEYFSILRGILETMPLKRMFPFVNREIASRSVSKGNMKWGLGTAAGLTGLFICLSCLFPYFAVSRLALEDKTLSSNLSEVLKTRENVEYYHNRQEALAGRINHYPYKIELIRLLNKLLPEKTGIRKLTISGNMVEIRGTTPKGSELLSAISEGKGIKNAGFTSPVTQDRKTGMSLFSISFAYEGHRETEDGS